MAGAISLVLHAHLPWVRHPEHADFLEEDWLYEAITECYVPVLDVLVRLRDEGVPARLALSISPTLLEMLDDPLLQYRASRRMGALVELAEAQARARRGGPFAAAASHAARSSRAVWHRYDELWQRRLIPVFRELMESGHIELLTTAATHGFLPLMASDAARRAQIAVGISTFERHFGTKPAGFWLPECGYTPGLDSLLAEAGVRWTVLERHGLLRARPPARYGALRPVWSAEGVAFFGRDAESSDSVWSDRSGYPADPVYREFYRDLGWDLPYEEVQPWLHADGVRRAVGLKFHAIGQEKELPDKPPYDPEAARRKAIEHGQHFAAARLDQLDRAEALLGLGASGTGPHLMVPYDAELFGHWWHEGPIFLEAALRALAATPGLALRTPSEQLDAERALQETRPSMSSWGRGGYFEVWLNEQVDWIYPHSHRAEVRMIELVARLGVDPLLDRAVAAAGRELLLAQSSDWAFAIRMGTSAAHAEARVCAHLFWFNQIYEQIIAGEIDERWLAEREARASLFRDLDPRVWREDGEPRCRAVVRVNAAKIDASVLDEPRSDLQ